MVNHSAREVERLKREEADGDHPIRTEAPAAHTYEWTDKATGEVHHVPVGIDPGWDYNPGKAAWGRTEALRLMEDKGPWDDIDPRLPEHFGRPEKVPVDKPRRLPTSVNGKTEAALTAALTKAIGGEAKVFTDPAGGRVNVTGAIVDHMMEKPARIDGREEFFPLIPELIEDPFEVWVNFAESAMSGRVGIRRRYVKAVRIHKNLILGMWAEVENGQWVACDFFRGGLTGAGHLRRGRLVYGR